MTLRTNIRGQEHTVAVPRHQALRVGTLNSILSFVAEYLGITMSEVRQQLFG